MPYSTHRSAGLRARWLLACATAVLAAACGGGPPSVPRNLLFVVFDTTRADHLGCFGYTRCDTTPTVDGLARDGAQLANVYAQSSLTPVSAGSFLTGTYPYRHGVRSLFVVGEESLSPEVPTLAELMARSGRSTAAFVSAKPMGSHYGLGRGFEHYDDDLSATRERYEVARFADAPQRPAEETTDSALAWLDEHGRDPFFALVHYFDAHDPSFVPPRAFLQQHVSFPLPAELDRQWSYAGVQGRRSAEAGLERLVELYDAEIRYMDAELARLLERLEQLGVREDTLVCVLADHGESFGEHGYFTHGWLAEEQLRVPVVLQGPAIPAGRVVTARLRTVDLTPTLAELFELAQPRAPFDGASAAAWLESERDGAQHPTAQAREVYAEVHHAPGDPRQREAAMFTLIDGDWKYIHRPQSRAHELYDLSCDPGETRNLFADDPERSARMAGELLRRGALGGAGVSLEGMTEQQLEDLRALGYLGSAPRSDDGEQDGE